MENEISDHEIVVYADDNTPIAADADPVALQGKIQVDADVVTGWFKKNDMICSSEKTKLLVIGTHANRQRKLFQNNQSLRVNVCDEIKVESGSEKLLGVIVNNTATFRHHLHGDDDNPGLIKELSTRVGMLKKIKRFLPAPKLGMVMDGLFGSKLAYGITVWGRVWNIPGNTDDEVRSPSLTKDDMKRLQVLQNKCLRILTNSDYKTPTLNLLEKTNKLSVHQQIAYQTLSQVYSVRATKFPAYHYRRLFMKKDDMSIGTRSNDEYRINRVNFNLSLCRSNFFYQSSRLWSSLPLNIKAMRSKLSFKKKCKSWVKKKIMIKP